MNREHWFGTDVQPSATTAAASYYVNKQTEVPIRQACAVAVGTTSVLHEHLNDMAEDWRKKATQVKGQLLKVGIQYDDIEEKYEKLISLSDRYTIS